jgi:gliding motility-associated-like protein
MKANQSGSRLALANGGFLHDVEVFDFNNETGEISNAIILDGYEVEHPYGIEFSPDGNLLYVSVAGEPGSIYQYNLLAGDAEDVNNSKTNIISGFEYGGAISLAPDGKIYHAGKDESWLGVIQDPNELGLACNYEMEGLFLEGKSSAMGLPNQANSIYQEPAVSINNVCDGDSTIFTININNVDSVSWNFGDAESGENNFSTEMQPAHLFSEIGSYNVGLEYYIESMFHSMVIQLKIYPNPDINLGADTLLCRGDEVLLDAFTYQAYYKWQDNSTKPFYLATQVGTYWVSVLANSCIGRDTISLENCDVFMEMPNVFTPNGDGINDYFVPLVYKEINNSTLIIFDRWGKQIFKNDNIEVGWDGSESGKNSEEGIYFYIVEYISLSGANHQLKGYVNLVR